MSYRLSLLNYHTIIIALRCQSKSLLCHAGLSRDEFVAPTAAGTISTISYT